MRRAVLAVVCYFALVLAFGFLVSVATSFQFRTLGVPVLTLTTIERDGSRHSRNLVRVDSNGELFVATNHWTKIWYNRALKNPEVHVTYGNKMTRYRATPATEEEHERVMYEYPLPLVIRFLTGFPPRHVLRLDPYPQEAQ